MPLHCRLKHDVDQERIKPLLCRVTIRSKLLNKYWGLIQTPFFQNRHRNEIFTSGKFIGSSSIFNKRLENLDHVVAIAWCKNSSQQNVLQRVSRMDTIRHCNQNCRTKQGRYTMGTVSVTCQLCPVTMFPCMNLLHVPPRPCLSSY